VRKEWFNICEFSSAHLTSTYILFLILRILQESVHMAPTDSYESNSASPAVGDAILKNSGYQVEGLMEDWGLGNRDAVSTR
jgi:hypothetical protein